MELGTFGAILKYGTEIEDAAATYYDGLAALASGDAKAAICEMAAASRKNKQILERTRRMEMQEMILEAISGLDTSNYDISFEPPGELTSGLAHALDIERRSSAFYLDAALKLGFLGNVKRTLERMGKERDARAIRIRSLR